MDDKQREFLETARAERREQQEKLKEKKDYFTTVTVFQTVICVILLLLIALISKSSTTESTALKNDYQRLMNTKMENTDSESVIKIVREFLNEPVNLMPAFLPLDNGDETAATSETSQAEETSGEKTETEKTEETESVEKETTANITVEASLEETRENKTDVNGKDTSPTENMGGEDVESYEAVNNATFSPVATTCEAVAPVNSTNYTSFFGYRISPITDEKSFHTGLDIAAPLGEEVVSSYSGTVRKTGEDDRSGKYVIVKHSDSLETVYCHLSKISVKDGQKVKQGEKIGLVGSTGWSTGPHLHFEVRANGKRVNPLTVLKNGN